MNRKHNLTCEARTLSHGYIGNILLVTAEMTPLAIVSNKAPACTSILINVMMIYHVLKIVYSEKEWYTQALVQH